MSASKVIPLLARHTQVPETVEALLALEQPAPPVGTIPEAGTGQETRVYILSWAWKSGEISLSSQRLLLAPTGMQDLRDRFQDLLDRDEILAFGLEEEPAELMTHAEFLEQTPILWPGLPPDDTPVRPEAA
jgi:hypothetical protein